MFYKYVVSFYLKLEDVMKIVNYYIYKYDINILVVFLIRYFLFFGYRINNFGIGF